MIRILLVSSKTVSIQGKIGTIKTKKMNTGRKNNPIFQPYGSNISRSSWRNDCASDSRSEGCVFESHRGQFPPTLEICSFLKNVSGKGLETFWGFVFPVKVPHFKEKITFLKHKKMVAGRRKTQRYNRMARFFEGCVFESRQSQYSPALEFVYFFQAIKEKAC